MKPLLMLLVSAICLAAAPVANGPDLGAFNHEADVGVVPHPGSCRYSAADHAYQITGNGANIWGTADAFHFVYRQLSGDLTLSADVHFLGKGKDGHRKACLMIRQSLAADAPYADVAVHGDGLISFQMRKTAGGPTTEVSRRSRPPPPFKFNAPATASPCGSPPKMAWPSPLGRSRWS